MALIYVVEDDANIREIETIALKNGGHTVEGASCARELFEKIEEKKAPASSKDQWFKFWE